MKLIEKWAYIYARNIVIPTQRGAIFACRVVQGTDLGAVCIGSGTKINIIKAHGLLGHGNKDLAHQTARHLRWIITHGNLKPYIHCAKSKARQKNIYKAYQSPKAAEPGRRVYFDLFKVTVLRSDGS